MTWREKRLGDVLTLKRGYDLTEAQRQPGDVPVVSSSGITGSHNLAMVGGPGVVTGRYGTMGEVFYVDRDFWPHNTSLYVRDFKGNDPRFIAYFLRNVLRGTNSNKAAVPGVNRNDLHERMVLVPDVQTQGRIIEHLQALDEGIENNRRRIALLEQSARLLHREWFVHLRFPGHEHFKTRDGVPDGWERKLIGDVAKTVGGGTPSTAISAYWDDGDITWFSPTDLTNNDCLALLDSSKKITEAGLKNSSAKMLPPETILMSSRASIGYFGMHDKPACTNQGFISLIPHSEKYRYYLLYNLMSRKGEIESKAGGATYKEINKSTFRAMPIVWPNGELAEEFYEFADSVMRQVRNLKRQVEALRQARDLLLPRLMSGDIQLS